MCCLPLSNYLRAFRKRLALTQDEVAFLLGVQSGTHVCRLELFQREPDFRTVLAYEAMFEVSGRELFTGTFHATQREIAERARELLLRMDGCKPSKRNQYKRQVLERLAALIHDTE